MDKKVKRELALATAMYEHACVMRDNPDYAAKWDAAVARLEAKAREYMAAGYGREYKSPHARMDAADRDYRHVAAKASASGLDPVTAASALRPERRAELHLDQIAKDAAADPRPAGRGADYWRWNEREVKRQAERRKWQDLIP